MLEHRLSLDGRITREIRTQLPMILDLMPDLVANPHPGLVLDGRFFRAIVLRAPCYDSCIVQRGVLLIKFTETFRFFYHRIDIPKLMRHFRIVLEPSWSGYCLPEILFWAQYSDPVIVQASEAADRQFLADLQTNLMPIEIGASDWVDHRIFRPLGIPKSFDVIYVANLTPMKRVNVYLRAISELKRSKRNVSAALVVSTWGGDKLVLDELIRFYDVAENLTVLVNQSQEQLNELVNRARVSVLLSLKEGSNKTLFESMFAGTPVLLLRSNVGVNKDYINAATGRLVDEKDLAAAIAEFGKLGAILRPREWAMANIAPERSTEKLAAKLFEIDGESERGKERIQVKVNTPEAVFMDASVAARMPHISEVLINFLREAPYDDRELDVRMQRIFATWAELPS